MENHMVFHRDFWYGYTMSRRKTTKDSIRNLQYSNGSYLVSLPMSLVRRLKWKERQKVIVQALGRSKIVISDWKPRSSKNPVS